MLNLLGPRAGLVNHEDFFPAICDHVAGGGTLTSFCLEHKLSYPAALRWIRSDVKRRERYELAQEDRDEYLIDVILEELRDLARIDLSKIFDKDGNQLSFIDWPNDIQRAVASIKKGKDGTEIKFHDKLRAIEMVGKKAKMVTTKVELHADESLESLLTKSFAPKTIATGGEQIE